MSPAREYSQLIDVTEEDVRACMEPFGITDASINEAVRSVHEWQAMQPHLPQVFDCNRTKKAYIASKGSIERTKQITDMYYSTRTLVPELFQNRDPQEPKFRMAMYTIGCCLMKRTYNNSRIILCKLMNGDPNRQGPVEYSKYMFMLSEIRLHADLVKSDIYVLDMHLIKMQHIAMFRADVLKKTLLGMKGFGHRIEAVHFINVHPYMEAFVRLIKSLLGEKLRARVHAHSDISTLFNFIPKEYLPGDYGSDEPTIAELHQLWIAEIDDWRDWFISEDVVRSDESRRPGAPLKTPDELFGTHGSFRTLNVD